MRRFPKFLAVVLAIAIIISSAMCLTITAESNNSVSAEYVDGNLVVTVQASEGFLASLVRLDVVGYEVDLDQFPEIEAYNGEERLLADPEDENSASQFAAHMDFEDGVLSFILMPKDDFINSATKVQVTVEMPEADGATRKYIAITKVQAAYAGAVDESGNFTEEESLLQFEGVAEDGTLETADVIVDECEHINTTTEEKDSHCLITGYTKVICVDCGETISTEEKPRWTHIDENFNGKCDHGCQTTVAYTDNGDDTHAVVWNDANYEATNVAHVDSDTDYLCDACGAQLEVPHEHTPVYEDNEDGATHKIVCECGETLNESEAHVDVDPADGECDICGAELVTECAHDINTTDNVNFVKFTAEGIEHYEVCGLCDEEIVTSVDTSANAVTVAGKASSIVAYKAINVKAAGNYSIDFAGYTDTNVKFAYVAGDKIKANGTHSSLTDKDATNVGANGENPFYADYVDGTANIEAPFAGIFLAFIPKDVEAVNVISNASMSTSYSAESKINLVFYLRRDRLVYNSQNVFSDFYGEITHHAYTMGDTSNTVKNVYAITYIDTQYNTDVYDAFPYAVAAMQMGDSVDCKYYGVRDGIDYLIRDKVNHSVVTYAASTSGFAGASTTAEKKTYLANMLRYGTQCQKKFGYRLGVYISEDSRIATYVADNITEYADDIDDITVVESSSEYKQVNGVNLFGISKSFAAESITQLVFIVNFGGKDGRFLDVYGEDEVKNVTYKFSVDGVMLDEVIEFSADVADKDVFEKYSTTQYMVKCNALTAVDHAKEVVLYGYYNGEEVIKSTYSINTHCKAKWNDTGAGAVADGHSGNLNRALYYYGESAKDYFNK